MNKLKIAVAVALLGIGPATLTATAAESTREQRMEEALQSYRSGSPRDGGSAQVDAGQRDSGAGPVARTGASINRGATKAVNSIESGVRRAGNAVARGADKATGAIRRTGERMGGSSTAVNPNNPANQ